MLDQTFFRNTVQSWLIFAGITAVVYIVLRIVLAQVIRRLKDFAGRTRTDLDDLVVSVLEKTRSLFLFLVALYAGSLILEATPRMETIRQTLVVLMILLQGALWATGVLAFLLDKSIRKRLAEDASAATSLSAIGFLSKLVIWTIVLLLALDNLGVNITGLIAGLGVGGIAVALALQNILGDLFGSLSIVLDKPFVIGDFIITGEHLGTVEHVGLKTTRIRSLGGEQIVFSNADLLGSRIRNYKRMQERRVVFSVGVTYQTTHAQLSRIPGMLKAIVEAQEAVRFDRAHFKEFADSSLVFEIVYYVLSPDFNAYMDVQQVINLGIVKKFEDEHIEFAYPTQTLFIQPSNGLPVPGASPGKKSAPTSAG